MAYTEVTGIATVPALIDAIVSALSSAGWTVDRNNLVSTNRTATVRAPGGSDYIHIFNTDTTNIRMRVSVGYSSGAAPSAQPNVSPNDSITNIGVGTYTRIHPMIDGDEAFIVMESATAGEYRHLAMGVLQKYGAYTGGTYADGTYRDLSTYRGYFGQGSNHKAPFSECSPSGVASAPYPGSVRADVSDDALANYFHRIGSASNENIVGTGQISTGVTDYATGTNITPSLNSLVCLADANTFSGRSIGHPINLFARRTGSPSFYSPIGFPKNVRFINLAKFNVGQEKTVGLDTWKMFPFFKRSTQRDTGSGAPDYGSWLLGYAIKKVP